MMDTAAVLLFYLFMCGVSAGIATLFTRRKGYQTRQWFGIHFLFSLVMSPVAGLLVSLIISAFLPYQNRLAPPKPVSDQDMASGSDTKFQRLLKQDVPSLCNCFLSPFTKLDRYSRFDTSKYALYLSNDWKDNNQKMAESVNNFVSAGNVFIWGYEQSPAGGARKDLCAMALESLCLYVSENSNRARMVMSNEDMDGMDVIFARCLKISDKCKDRIEFFGNLTAAESKFDGW